MFFQSDLLAVEWLRDIPDDLDVCIAQRDFEGAMSLIEKGTCMCIIIRLLYFKKYLYESTVCSCIFKRIGSNQFVNTSTTVFTFILNLTKIQQYSLARVMRIAAILFTAIYCYHGVSITLGY